MEIHSDHDARLTAKIQNFAEACSRAMADHPLRDL
jgi:hypothetical protein